MDIVIQKTGKIIVSGRFTTYKGAKAGYLTSLYGDSKFVILPDSTDKTTIVDEFTSKGYTEGSSGALVGSTPISLEDTNGAVPSELSLTNDNININLSTDTQLIETNTSNNYNGIISVPITKPIISVNDEPTIAAFNVGSLSESISLQGGIATISIPVIGQTIGSLVNVYYSEDNGVTWFLETKVFVVDNNGDPYVSFTTNHFADFAITQASESFTGSFVINN